MQITNLQLENFGSHAQSTLDLRDRGLILIEGENRDQGGSNGAGKSTLFEALGWGLFGAVNSGLRGPDVIRTGQAHTTVRVDLDVDGRRVEVERSRGLRSSTTLELRIDGEDARGSNVRETQLRLLRLLQLDWESFCSVVMFPQEKEGIAAQTDAEQKGVLDTILTLKRFAQARLRTRELHSVMTEDVRKLRSETRELEATRTAHNEAIGRLNKQQREFESENQIKITRLEAELVELLKLTPPSPQPVLDRLAELQQQLDRERAVGEETLNVFKQLEHKRQLVERELRETEAKIKVSLARITDIKVLDPHEELALQDTCPACDQQLPAKAQESLLYTLTRQAQEAREKKDGLLAENAKLNGQAVELIELMNKVDAAIEITREKLVDTSETEAKIREVEYQTQAANNALYQHEQAVQQLQLQLGQLRASTSPYLQLLQETGDARTKIDKQLENKKRELEPLEDELKYVDYWMEGFGNQGVKSLLMSTVTPFLNQRANIYLQELSNGTAHITIKTQTQLRNKEFRDKMDFKVTYPGGSDLYRAKSGGERRRADIAILFALGDLAASRAMAPVECRFLDEVFDALDPLGCEQVVGLLRNHVLPRARSVFVMSHNPALRTLFEHRIKVVKENGISRVEAA